MFLLRSCFKRQTQKNKAFEAISHLLAFKGLKLKPSQMSYLLSRLRDLCERWLLPLSLSALRLLLLRDELWEELLLERRLLL